MLKFILALILFVQLNITTAFAMPPIMPLNEVQKGMTGIAYTSMDPSGAIQTFNVKIIGITQTSKSAQPFIVAEASGDLINRTGGVLQGMSGSPIYVNGKIIGALSATYSNMSPYLFLITPIENMLNIWKHPDNFKINPYAQAEATEDVKTDDNEEDSDDDDEVEDEEEVIITDGETVENKETAEDEEEILTDDVKEKVHSIYSGFNDAGLKFLKTSLSEFNLKDYEITAVDNNATDIKYDAKLTGGSPVGIAVVYGDFAVGATGTVTLVDDNKVLAFGHKYTHNGNVNFFMTDVKVIGGIPGMTGGARVSSVGPIIGRFNQDRAAGVGGIVGQFPSVVPISVTVNDKTYNSLIAYNESLVPKLGAAVTYSALGNYLDTDGANGTVKLSFDIKTDAVDGGTLSRENMFYNAADVGQASITELMQALALICENSTNESNILGIDVKMNFDPLRNTASLVKAEPVKRSVKPGEEVKLKVTLQPYRRKEFVIEIPYKVPITAKEGAFVLDLHGGGLVPLTQVQQAGVVLPSTKSPKQVYNDKFKQLLTSNKNNEIVIKPAVMVKTEKELKAEIKRVKKLSARLQKLGVKPSAATPSKFATDYIIDNVIQCTLNIEKL